MKLILIEVDGLLWHQYVYFLPVLQAHAGSYFLGQRTIQSLNPKTTVRKLTL